ncbi:MAG: T9SS type A sorting domain-containing protein, partial [Bacteroidia bacterium]|nr:T9SS type A sorting domain-containing protein [Bacteroidia bacterium]
VFRNSNGSIVGRDVDGSDIFTDVYPEEESLFGTVISPTEGFNVISKSDSLKVTGELNRKAFVQVIDNQELVYSDSTAMFDFYISEPMIGSHQLEFIFQLDEDSLYSERGYIVFDEEINLSDPPPNTIEGVNYYTDSSYIFRLYAPEKQNVFFLCPQNGFIPEFEYLMNKSEDGKTYWIELPKSIFLDGNNVYQYLVDGSITIGDPYSSAVLDPWNDPYITNQTMSQFPDYPDNADGYVTVFDLQEKEYDWEVNDFKPRDARNLVVYELLIRDFLADHSYKSLIDTLDYLEALGITAIELMPVYEFEGNISWGYNPSYHLAVDKYYGTEDDLKQFIDEAHKRGIAVFLDIVFNHAFGQSPMVQLYWNSKLSRPSPNSPWFNEVPKHPFNVGYDFNHESEDTKRWVKRNLEQWITEFRFDGFRFDLSKGFTQFDSGNDAGLMSRYDASRIAILKEYSDYIWSLNPDCYSIMEHFADNSEEKELSDYGIMFWGNINHEFSEAAMGYASDLEYSDYKVRGWSEPNLIAYMESHDEERMMYKLKTYGDSNSEYNTRLLETSLRRVAAASAIFYGVPGPKMLWQFGELGYDFSINYCPNGTINDDCRVDPKPIRWDYLENEDRKALYERISDIIHLRTSFPTFSTNDYTFSDGNFYLKTVHLRHPEMDAIVLANYRIVNSDINPKFMREGTWYEYFTGDSIEVVNTQEKLTFGPGEYRIYTNKRLTPPNGFTTSTVDPNFVEISLGYPNPIHTGQELTIEIPGNSTIQYASFYDVNGKEREIQFEQHNQSLFITIPSIPKGLYFIQMTAGDGLNYTSKIVVH